jgi:hypothetical protein
MAMGRTAKHGLSRHETKGYRLSLGKKADGSYKSRWLGQDRAVADYASDSH